MAEKKCKKCIFPKWKISNYESQCMETPDGISLDPYTYIELEGNELYFHVDNYYDAGGGGIIKIKYCPFCGRML